MRSSLSASYNTAFMSKVKQSKSMTDLGLEGGHVCGRELFVAREGCELLLQLGQTPPSTVLCALRACYTQHTHTSAHASMIP